MAPGALRRLVCIAIGGCGLALASGGPAAAHPHVWITAVATLLFDDRMLVGVHHHWEFDEMFGSYVIEEHDANGDGKLDRAEIASIEATAFSNLRDYDYFTHVRIDGKDMPLHEVTDFTARIEDGVLVYEFTMPLAKPIDPGANQFAAVDAPTTADLLEIVQAWHREGRTVVVVLHHLAQLRTVFPETLLLAREVVAWDATDRVLRPDHLLRAWGMPDAFAADDTLAAMRMSA
jgi:Protein of unknown function (DUF1007)